jgi:Nif-specific regulatory protein
LTNKASDSDLGQIPAPPPIGSDPGAVSTNDSGAYLVLQSAGRWSDVFRLSPPAQAIIGRASSNQIVIRSDQASRRHAKIAWDQTGWSIEDLGSRNGTFLNGQRLAAPHTLSDGDMIEIAGFGIQFTRQIAGSAGPAQIASGSSQATDDQITMEVDPGSITDRRRHSLYLHHRASARDLGQVGLASSHLLQLAFTLARTERTNEAVESVLECLSEQVAFGTAGVYLSDPKANQLVTNTDQLTLAGTRQSGSRSYRRPPDSLVEHVSGSDGQAVLARNVLGDRKLATENSRGEIDAESVIIAPVRDREGVLRGLLHLTTAAGQSPLTGDDLEFVVAVSEILAASLAGLTTRKQLNRSLQRSRRQIKQLQQQLGDKVRIVGQSDAINNVVQQVSMAAPTNATVLIRGESGVGKELVAAALHHASARRDGPLICMNCAALSPTLLESELFGHEKGAFTGATDRKQGKFEAADGGTLMLDEIGEMSPEIQSKFLRVLEGHPFERVGGHAPVKVDVRVVAATNRDLQAMVREGKFRQDLFYRLHVVEIIVPPLRQRGQDVIGLAEFFLDSFNQEMGRKITGFTDAAKQRLLDYSWPGNIRELKNVIERAVVLNTETVIDETDLALAPAVAGGTASAASDAESVDVEMTLAELERAHIERVLRHTGGNKSRAAGMLGIERSTLDRKLKKFAAS